MSIEPTRTLDANGDPVTVADLLAEDRSTWPDGHPCRDCGRLWKEHPVTASVLECRDWR